MRRFFIAKYQQIFIQICLVQTGLFYQIGNVLWVLMSTLLSAACHLVAMICIVTPWFICVYRISTDKLSWYSCLQFIENKQTNNSIQRVYYVSECLDWPRLVFRVLLLGVNVCTPKNTRCSDSSQGLRHFVELQFTVHVTNLSYKLKLHYTTRQSALAACPQILKKNAQRNPQQR